MGDVDPITGVVGHPVEERPAQRVHHLLDRGLEALDEAHERVAVELGPGGHQGVEIQQGQLVFHVLEVVAREGVGQDPTGLEVSHGADGVGVVQEGLEVHRGGGPVEAMAVVAPDVVVGRQGALDGVPQEGHDPGPGGQPLAEGEEVAAEQPVLRQIAVGQRQELLPGLGRADLALAEVGLQDAGQHRARGLVDVQEVQALVVPESARPVGGLHVQGPEHASAPAAGGERGTERHGDGRRGCSRTKGDDTRPAASDPILGRRPAGADCPGEMAPSSRMTTPIDGTPTQSAVRR